MGELVRSGLIGRSILHSGSPRLHEGEAAAQGFALRYDLFDFTARGLDDAALGPLLRRLIDEGYAGVNVTFPFKQAVMPLLDAVDDSAAVVGAVNTVVIRAGRATGHNTDGAGFADSLARGLPGVALGRVLLIGAGGAGAAVGAALLDAGVGALTIADTDAARAEALAVRLSARGPGRAAAGAAEAAGMDGIVNATPIGMASHPGMPIDPALLESPQWVADIIYFPRETALLAAARARGCRVMNGEGMVVAQAARAFALITGQLADAARMAANLG